MAPKFNTHTYQSILTFTFNSNQIRTTKKSSSTEIWSSVMNCVQPISKCQAFGSLSFWLCSFPSVFLAFFLDKPMHLRGRCMREILQISINYEPIQADSNQMTAARKKKSNTFSHSNLTTNEQK